jgi:ubiquitin-like 1-activating enzyme E1 A
MSTPSAPSGTAESASSYGAVKPKATTAPTASDVYDRQIRLWGAEAQKKMQQSRVLYIHVTGTTSEVLKNLVLAGVAAALCDTRSVAGSLDPNPCFFSGTATPSSSPSKKARYESVAHAVRPLVEELNPLLGPCPVLGKTVEELTEEDVRDYTVVIASQIPLSEAVRLSKMVAHDHGHAFYLADCFGMRGAAMIDLGAGFQYRPEQGNKLLDPVGLKDYVPLPDLVDVPLSRATNRFHKQPPPTWILYRCLLEYQKQTGLWLGADAVDVEKAKTMLEDYLKEQDVTLPEGVQVLDSLITAGMAQVAPVCAVLGGMIGNEVIKYISGKGEPANNTLLLDGTACKVWTFLVKNTTAP